MLVVVSGFPAAAKKILNFDPLLEPALLTTYFRYLLIEGLGTVEILRVFLGMVSVSRASSPAVMNLKKIPGRLLAQKNQLALSRGG